MNLADINLSLSREQLLAVYGENVSYDATGDLASCQRFIAAARCLLATPVRRSAAGGRGGEEVEIEPRIVLEQLQRAERWAAARTGPAIDRLPRVYAPDPYWRG